MPLPKKESGPKDEHPVASDSDIEHIEFGPKSRALIAEIEKRSEAAARRAIREELAGVVEAADHIRESSEFKLKKALRGE